MKLKTGGMLYSLHLRLTFALSALSSCVSNGLKNSVSGWFLSTGTNNIYSRCSSPTSCQTGVAYVGNFSSITECAEAAESQRKLHLDDIRTSAYATSFTWHHNDFPDLDYASHCYAISDGNWLGQTQDGVDSGWRPAPCKSVADCAYNGRCTADSDSPKGAKGVEGGFCDCVPQFQGSQCDRFAFVPIDMDQGIGLRTVLSSGQQVSSWGGSIILAEDGNFHMWAAEMTEETGIKAWITNSQIVHAVANSSSSSRAVLYGASDLPHGTTETQEAQEAFGFDFVRKEVVFPVFAHEPTVSRAPSGEYVMFFTTNYEEKPGSQCGPPCTCGFNGTSCLQCPNDQQCGAPQPRSPLSSRMSYAQSPHGPWSSPELIPSPGNEDTNLACVIRPNSSLVCLGRPDLGALHSDNWKDVKSYTWHPTRGDAVVGEDPMVWRNVEQDGTEILHAVTHGGGWGDPFGYHYWSLDGGFTWRGTQNKAYFNDVDVVRGGERLTTKILSRRERPHVVLSKHNGLLALSNGVTEAWPCTLQVEPDRPPCTHPPTPGVNPNCGPGSNGTSIWCPVDYSYTLVQPLRQQAT